MSSRKPGPKAKQPPVAAVNKQPTLKEPKLSLQQKEDIADGILLDFKKVRLKQRAADSEGSDQGPGNHREVKGNTTQLPPAVPRRGSRRGSSTEKPDPFPFARV